MSVAAQVPPPGSVSRGRDRSIYHSNPEGVDVTDGEYFKQNDERKVIGRIRRLPGGGHYVAWQFISDTKGFKSLGPSGDFHTALTKIELCQPLTSKPKPKKKRQPCTRKPVQPNRA